MKDKDNDNFDIRENFNLEEQIKQNQIRAKQLNPGIFRITCLKNKKVYFGESNMLLIDLPFFAQKLAEGICENSELLSDFKKFGPDGFAVELFLTSENLSDPRIRLKVFEAIKKAWPGELYNP